MKKNNIEEMSRDEIGEASKIILNKLREAGASSLSNHWLNKVFGGDDEGKILLDLAKGLRDLGYIATGRTQ